MSEATASKGLPLAEALVQWSDLDLVEAVRACERRYTVYELTSFHQYKLTPDHERRQPGSRDWIIGPPDFTELINAWDALGRDFRERLVRGEIYLQGVQTKPERTTVPQPIPGAWAADCQFDFAKNTVDVDQLRYVAVIASQTLPPTETSEAGSIAYKLPEVTPGSIRHLTDDEVLLLLEDHARRVVESDDAKLIMPGKISLMPIIKRKMQYRRAQGNLLPTLTAEAAELADWIATKVPSHHVPTAGAIENSLRSDYWRLKP